MAEQLQGDHYR